MDANQGNQQAIPSIKRTDTAYIAVLNAVDDQLYFATDPFMKEWFEDATQSRFDVQFIGQANWYL
jgi:hypothetical protein